jgi:uncharacterized protein
MSNGNYIGQVLAFPLGVNVQESLQLNPIIQSIEESIRIILQTPLGERLYQPDFGSRLKELVFAPMNIQTLLLAKFYTQNALQQWEHRIMVDGICAEADPVRGRIDIVIEYRPRDSYEKRSLVYPLYLIPQS